MKNLFIVLVASTFVTISFSQSKYIPFIGQNKYWVYNQYQDFETNRIVNSYMIWTGQDSVINGKIFYKFYRSNLDGFPISPTNFNFISFTPYKFKDKTLSWLITEDTLQKKVYFKFQDSLKLLYDFNLEVGQRLDERLLNIIRPSNWPIKDSLGKITEIKIENSFNKDRNTWVFNGPEVYGDPVVTDILLIEGIGILNYNGFYPSYDRLYDFCEGTLEQCNIVSSTKNTPDTPSNKIKIFPNPTSDYIILRSPTSISKVEIFDQNNRIVISSQSLEIDVSSLISGVYFVRCITSNNVQYYQKFIKI